MVVEVGLVEGVMKKMYYIIVLHIVVALVVVNLINLELSHLLHHINVNNERMIVKIPVLLYWILME